MRKARLIKRLLILWIAGGGLGLTAAGSDVRDMRGVLSSPFVSAWALADFDGDLIPDLAIARPVHHDSLGYAQEVRIDFGQFAHTSFTFQSRAAKVEFLAWDIDGDDDRDIVVVEVLSKRPIGVWLNDGTGSFEQADLAKFQNLLGGDSARGWRATPEVRVPSAAVEQAGQAAFPSISIIVLEGTAEALASENAGVQRNLRRADLRNRAPPRDSSAHIDA